MNLEIQISLQFTLNNNNHVARNTFYPNKNTQKEKKMIPGWIKGNSSWLPKSFLNQDFTIVSFQIRNFNGVTTFVTPIKIPSNPI